MTESCPTIDYSPLVLAELQVSLAEVAANIRSFVDSGSPAARRQAAGQLQQIGNTLELISIRGARLLVEEIILLVDAPALDDLDDTLLQDGASTQQLLQSGKVIEARYMLLIAIGKLDEYLDYLKCGGADMVLALVPLVNNLRACRQENFLSENIFVESAFRISAESEAFLLGHKAAKEFATLLREVRMPMMQGVLEFCKRRADRADDEAIAVLSHLDPLLARLQQNSPSEQLQDLWALARAVCASVNRQELSAGPAVRQMLVRLERYTDDLRKQIEEQLQQPNADRSSVALPPRLFRNLLYYVALSTSRDDSIVSLREKYRLAELLPELPADRQHVGRMQQLGANLDTSIIDSLLRETESLRQLLEHHAETGLVSASELVGAGERIQQVAATLLLLGEAQAESDASEAARLMSAMVENPDPLELASLATHLLQISERLEEVRHNGTRFQFFAGSFERNLLDERRLSAYQLDKIVLRCLSEAQVQLEEAEHSYSDYVEASVKTDELAAVVTSSSVAPGKAISGALLKSAEGIDIARQALMIIPLPELAPLLTTCAAYLRHCSKVPADTLSTVLPADSHDAFADLLVNTWQYLDSNVQSQRSATDLLQNAEVAMNWIEGLLSADYDADGRLLPRQVSRYRYATASSLSGIASEGELPDAPSSLTPFPDGANVDGDAASEKLLADNGRADGLADGLANTAAQANEAALSSSVSTLAKSTEATENSEDTYTMSGSFTEDILARFGVIGHQFEQWHRSGSAESLKKLEQQYQHIEELSRHEGALDLLELAGSNRKLLARVIEAGETPAETSALLQESVAVLPQLLNHLQSRPPVSARVRDASKAGSSRKVDQQAEVELQPEAVYGLRDLLSRLDSHAVTDSAAPSSSARTPGMDATLELDETLLHRTTLLDAAQNAADESNSEGGTWPTVRQKSSWDSTSGLEFDSTADSTLFSVFRAECSGHVATLKGVASAARECEEPVLVSDRFAYTLHTLQGSAMTAEEPEIAALSNQLQQYTSHFRRQAKGLNAVQWGEVGNAVEALSFALDARAAGVGAADVAEPAIQRLQAAVLALRDQENHRDSGGRHLSNRSQAARTGEDAGAMAVNRHQLFPVFTDEADGILRRLQHQHDALRALVDIEPKEQQQQRQQRRDLLNDGLRQLHTLKGSARVAGCDSIARLAHEVETTWLQWRNDDRGVDVVRCTLFQSTVDALTLNLEQERNGYPAADFDLLLSELRADLDVTEVVQAENACRVSGPENVDSTVAIAAVDQHSSAAFATHAQSGWDDDRDERDDKDDKDSTLKLEAADSVDDSLEFDATIAEHGEPLSPALSSSSIEAQADHPIDATLLLPGLADTTQRLHAAGDKTLETQTNPADELPGTETGERAVSVRVDGNLLGRLSSLVTQVSMQHAQLNQGVLRLHETLLDLDRTSAMLRRKLQDLDLETSLLPGSISVADHQSDAGLVEDADQTLSLLKPFSGSGDAVEQEESLAQPVYADIEQGLLKEENSRQLSEVLHDLDTIRDSLHEQLCSEEESLARSSRLTTEIHQSVLKATLVRFDELQHRFETVVRQAAHVRGKEVKFDLQGGAVAIDQAIHQQLAAPIEHLLRNAIAHGVEDTAERKRRGKPEQGLVQVAAHIDGNFLKLDVRDDGAGVDFDKLRTLIGDSTLDDARLLARLPAQGLSTQSGAQTDLVAGHGVGLGTASKQISDLGGSLTFVSSSEQGTHIALSIALQLQMHHAVVFEYNGFTFGIPSKFVRAVKSISELNQRPGGASSLQFVMLGELFQRSVFHQGLNRNQQDGTLSAARILAEGSSCDQVVEIEHDGRRAYIRPDRLLGFRDLLSRPIGAQLASIGLYCGVCQQADGSSLMLLDTASVMQRHRAARNALSARDAQAATWGADIDKAVPAYAPVEADPARPLASDIFDVMIVDDSVTLRTYTRTVVEETGLKALDARDGLEALEALKCLTQLPKLLIVDVEMPRMDGFQLVAALRQKQEFQELPIVMISSRTGPVFRQRAANMGVVAYLGKPYQSQELMSVLQNVFAGFPEKTTELLSD